jgi:glucose-1-phosphate thymidylyltransferase
MILHPVEKLTEAGVSEILIVTGVEHMGSVVNLLGSGKEYQCRFTYKVQDEPGGIAQALSLAETFCKDSRIVVLLGDNIFQDSLKTSLHEYRDQPAGARILLKEVSDPQRFGVAELSGQKIVGIEEKPQKPKSSLAVTGIYFYDEKVFEIIRTLKPSKRGELEITDVNNYYVTHNLMTYSMLKGQWTDAGTFESLKTANDLMLNEE